MTRGDIFTEEHSVEVNIPPRSDIEAIDRPTVLSIPCYIYYIVR